MFRRLVLRRLAQKQFLGIPALLLIFVVVYLFYLHITGISYNLPFSQDAGAWLLYSKALFSQQSRYILQELLPLRFYSFIPFLILGSLEMTFGASNSLLILGYVAVAFQIFGFFCLANYVLENKQWALLATLFNGLFPGYQEMFGWSAFPNIIAIGFEYFAILYVLKSQQRFSFKNAALSVAFLVALVSSHNLTSVVLAFIFGVYFLLSVVFKFAKRPIFLGLLILVLMLWFYRLLTGGVLILFNDTVFYLRTLSFASFSLVFMGGFIGFLLILVTSTISMHYLYEKDKGLFSLFLSWLTFPLIFSIFSHLKLVSVDEQRLPYYLAAPLIILAVMTLQKLTRTGISHKQESEVGRFFRLSYMSKVRIKEATRLVALFLVVTLLCANSLGGIIQIRIARDHYINAWSNESGSDSSGFELLQWVGTKTAPEDAFATRELIGSWISGYADRRTYRWLPEEFVFTRVHAQEASIAETLLSANVLSQNGMFKVVDTAPDRMNFTPRIFLYEDGEYLPFASVDEGAFSVVGESTSDTLNSSSIFLRTTIDKANYSYTTEYLIGQLYWIKRIVNLTNDEAAIIQYKVFNPNQIPIKFVSLSLETDRAVQQTANMDQLLISDKVTFSTNASQYDVEKSDNTGSNRITLRLIPLGENSTLAFCLQTQNVRTGFFVKDVFYSPQIISDYHISYVVIAKSDVEAKNWMLIQIGFWRMCHQNSIFEVYCLRSQYYILGWG